MYTMCTPVSEPGLGALADCRALAVELLPCWLPAAAVWLGPVERWWSLWIIWPGQWRNIS